MIIDQKSSKPKNKAKQNNLPLKCWFTYLHMHEAAFCKAGRGSDRCIDPYLIPYREDYPLLPRYSAPELTRCLLPSVNQDLVMEAGI